MLTRLDIQGVRNLVDVRLDTPGLACVFFGSNGSGKTSVLEAIHLLAMARSFRSVSVSPVITHGKVACTVYGELTRGEPGSQHKTSLGVQRERSGALTIKVSGQPAQSVAELAAQLPLLVINAETFGLLTGSPAARRQYIDWGVFHVEHEFLGAWRRFQRALKQRNSLLRHVNIDRLQLAGWTRDLAVAGEAITAARQRYLADLEPVFTRVLQAVLPDCPGVRLQFRRGWSSEKSYADALHEMQATDREQGFTQSGPQRSDLRVTVNGHSAADTLSRGQQKLVVCVLKLAQGYVHAKRGASAAYLIDDLPSELDAEHTRLICEQLVQVGAQVFITCIDPADIERRWPSGHPLSLFHVEHGRVQAAVQPASG